MTLIYGLAAFVLFGLETLVYVLAQAWVGSRGGIRVLAIQVGFGPVLFRCKIRGCEVRVSSCPWGGYTQFQGMQPDDLVGGSGNFLHASPWTRMAVCAVGPVTNLFAGLLFLGIPVWRGADQMVVSSPNESGVRPCAVGGLAFLRQPSTWSSQSRLTRDTAGEFMRRIVLFESLDGWGGPVGFLTTSGAIAKVSLAGWLTAQGVLALAMGLWNLLPIPPLNGSQLFFTALGAIFGIRLPERVVLNLTYAGLFLVLAVFFRILYIDVVWVIGVLRS